jgi:molybdopterin biosynthesis enzyme
VITSGGVSVGDFDHVKAVLEEICAAGGGWARSIAVAIKPAKPFAFGVYVGDSGTTRKPVFGLPGNPVSSLVSYEMLARPALRAMAGHPDPLRPTIAGRAAEGFPRSPDGRVHLVRVNIACEDGEVVARSVGSQGSHQLAATAASDGLAVVPDGAGLEAGALVDLIPIDWP